MRKLFTVVIAVLMVFTIAAPKAEAFTPNLFHAFGSKYDDEDHWSNGRYEIKIQYYIDEEPGTYGVTPYASRIYSAFDDWRHALGDYQITLKFVEVPTQDSADLVFLIDAYPKSSVDNYGSVIFYPDGGTGPVYSYRSVWTGSASNNPPINEKWQKGIITLPDYMYHHYCDAAKTVAMIGHQIGNFLGFSNTGTSSYSVMDMSDRNVFSGKTYHTLYEQGYYAYLGSRARDLYIVHY